MTVKSSDFEVFEALAMDSIGSTGGKSGKLFPVVAGKPRRHMTCPGGIYQVLLFGLDLQTTRFAVPLSQVM